MTTEMPCVRTNAAAIAGVLAAGAILSVFAAEVARCEEWFPGDESVRGSHSQGAAAASNIPLTVAMVTPLAVLAREGGGDRERKAGIYGLATVTGLAVNAGVKRLALRPRPYTHSAVLEVRRFSETQGLDSRLSFYSGHASAAFTAATAGSLLAAGTLERSRDRQALWAGEAGLATATALLRVRGGMHYYSDVLVGALAGIGIGAAMATRLAGGAEDYRPDAADYRAAATGSALGAAVTMLWPFDPAGASTTLLPTPVGTGGIGVLISHRPFPGRHRCPQPSAGAREGPAC